MAYDRLEGRKTLSVGGFLEEFQKDEVKRRVDLVELFASFGVELKKKGKSYVGHCPWHEDKTPSLSVDREKGLYNCFGCGESGDVFSLVQKMKGVEFPEALESLRNFSAGRAAGTRKTTGRAKPGKDRPASPAPSEDNLPVLTLDTISGYYRKRLPGNSDALAYLAKRGLESPELLGRFSVGFADGTLLPKVSNGQKERLKELGIIQERGGEHLFRCVTIPLHDDAGRTVGLYGRKIEENGSVKHLYLKGPHRGVFNRKAGRVYDEIVLTESILDGLSLVSLGIENVQALYGTNGLTEEHLSLLKADRVKTVVLALDADQAGRKASVDLKEKLLKEGFSVKIVHPHEGKDWNEALVTGAGADAIRAMMEEAPVFSPPEAEQELTVSRKGPKYLFTTGGVSYRLLGVSEIFVSSLRVNIRAEKDDVRFIDNVDLYSARSRTAFSSTLSSIFDMEAKRIEKDLLSIVEYLEGERDRKLAVGSEEKEIRMTAEEEELGLEFLKSPDLFDQVVRDTELLGYVGEEINKQLAYLAASSRKLDDPVSVIIVSQAASGKSMLIDTVRRLMPPEDVVALTSLSDQALNYFPEGGLLHKFLILGEAVHSDLVDHQIREMLSAHELSRLVTMKDEKTGEMSSRMIKSRTVVSMMMSTTDPAINPENASRCFVVGSDESAGQTARIHEAQRRKYTLGRYYALRNEIPQVVRKHAAAQRLLKKVVIVNPFGSLLGFPKDLMRSRRDHDRFIDLVACVCFLRQYQKEVKKAVDPASGEGHEYIECDTTDYSVAYRIMVEGILCSTYTEPAAPLVRLYEELRKYCRKLAKSQSLKVTEVSFSQGDVRERVRWIGRESIKRYLRILAGYEYIWRQGGVGRGQRSRYCLVADEPMEKLDFSMVPTPEEIAERMKVGNL